MPALTAHCLRWHLTQSDAFRDLLVEPLAGRVDVLLTDAPPRPDTAPLVFCQIAPPPELLRDPSSRIIWIPMWDNVATYNIWRDLPGHVRVVAFSDAVAERAEAAGLPTLRLRYFRDPSLATEVSWAAGPTVFHWNRTGLIGPEFLERLCRALDARRLLFRPDLDPGAPPELAYRLPATLGTTQVEIVPWTTRDQYLQVVSRSNVYVGPRIREGVGMTFLEAMSRGAAVLAFDGATMNEYIRHKETGYLFGRTDGGAAVDLATRALRRIAGTSSTRRTPTFALSARRYWGDIGRADLRTIGGAARSEHAQGFAEWQNSLDRFAAFLIDW